MNGGCTHQGACPVGQWCHTPTPISTEACDTTVCLVGHANVGKSVLFHQLTGRYATVSNYPGTTVEREVGEMHIAGRSYRLMDVPGVSGSQAVSEDERIALSAVHDEPDAVLVVVGDATQLLRTVLMALDVAQWGHPTVVALNMMDEAEAWACAPDVAALSRALGLPVVPLVATAGEGVEALKEAIARAERPASPPVAEEASALLTHAREIVQAVLPTGARRTPAASWSRRIAEWMVRPATGLPILAAVLWGMYALVGVFGAGTLVGLMEESVFGQGVVPFVAAGSQAVFGEGWMTALLVGPYGLVSMGVSYALAIVLPVMTCFFLAFGFLEDVGYLPRLTILSDRLFRVVGLHGKAVLPTVLGFGCGTMAVLTTRILESRKERLLATLLIALAIPCSAQLGVMIGLASHISVAAFAAVALILASQFLLVGIIASRWMKGTRSDFVVALPPLRWPHAMNIVRKTLIRVKWYLVEAVPFFVAGTLLLFVLDRVDGLVRLEAWGAPVVQDLLGLPAVATRVLLLGFLRRDYGAAGLFAMAGQGLLTPHQVIVSLVTITLFIPCIASFFVMVKERGWKTAMGLLGFITPYAVAVGAATHWVLGRFAW